MDNNELLQAIRAIVKEEIQANNQNIKEMIKENNQAIAKAIITAIESSERNVLVKIDELNLATATNSYDIAVLRNKKQA